MRGFIQKATNSYRGKFVNISDVFVGRNAARAARASFDAAHLHHPTDCDYCKTKWKSDGNGGFVKDVDHDGAAVSYEVESIEVHECR